MKKILVVPLLFLLIILSACEREVPRTTVLKTINGESIDFSALNNQWVILNYWASWCGPCKKEIPELNAFSASHKNVRLLAVNFDGVEGKELTKIISQSGIRYDSITGDPSVALNLGDIPGIPVTFVFDPKGRLHKKLFGPQTNQSLSEAMK